MKTSFICVLSIVGLSISPPAAFGDTFGAGIAPTPAVISGITQFGHRGQNPKKGTGTCCSPTGPATARTGTRSGK